MAHIDCSVGIYDPCPALEVENWSLHLPLSHDGDIGCPY